jgi:hypothetical protein
MRFARARLVVVLGAAVVATASAIVLTSNGMRPRAAAVDTAEAPAAADVVDHHQSGASRSTVETAEQRERTERARQVLAAALALGASAQARSLPTGQAQPASEGDPARQAPDDSVEDPHENRRLIVQDIAASGGATEAWTQTAPKVFAGMKDALSRRLAGQVSVRNVECYEKACIADVSYADMKVFDEAAALFLQDAAFERWPGPKGRTAPEPFPSGRVEVTWLLMNPNERTP